MFSVTKNHRVWLVPLLLVMLGLPAMKCFAQFSGSVQGTISDATGAVVTNAGVILHNSATGVDQKSTTNGSGFYRFTAVAPGDYTVTVTRNGFKTVSESVAVTSGETRGADITLQAGSAGTEVVTVTGQAPALNLEETRVQETISSSEVDKLPLPNRDVQMLMSLTPGVIGAQNETPAAGYGSTIFAANFQPPYVANGEGVKSNLILVDDLPVSDEINQGAALIIPNSEMIDQVALQSQTYSVENGTSSSLQTAFATKSGGNALHGSLDYSYAGNNVGAARMPTHALGQPVTTNGLENHQDIMLGSLGGPILKDRTFFFGSVEKQLASVGGATIDQPQFTSAFSNWALQAFPNSPMAQALTWAPVTRDSGGTTKTAADYGMACGTTQQVPANTSLTYNLPCSTPIYNIGATFNQSQPFDGIQWNVRLDQVFRGGKDRVYVMYERIDQTLGDLAARAKLDSNSPSQNKYLSASYVHMFSGRLLNEVHAGNLRTISGLQLVNPESASIPYNPIGLDTAAGYQFTFFFGIMPFASQTEKEHTYSLRDTLSYTLGKHSFRGGYQFFRGDVFQDSSGIYTRAFYPFIFSDSISIVSNQETAGFNSYTIGGNGKITPQMYGATSIYNGLWLEDSWKVRSNLTLTAGIRYDDFGNPTKYGSTTGQFVPLFPGAGSTFQQQAWNTTTKDARTAFTESQNWNFMPRVGFAYSPSKAQNTLVRGGIGLYENVLTPFQIAGNLPTQPPNRISLYETAQIPFGDFKTAGYPYGYNYSYPTYGTDPSGNIYSCPAMTDTANCLFSANLNGFAPTLKPEKFLNYSLGIEHQFPTNLVVGINYAGSYGFDEIYGSTAGGGGNADYNLQPNSPKARPTFEWGSLNYGRNGLSSDWNALILTAKQSYKGFTYQANYNWEKALQWAPTVNSSASGDNYYLWNGVYDPKTYHGPANFDQRNTFSLGGSYATPKINSELLDQFAGGWRLGVIAILQSGTPFTVVEQGVDYQNNGCNKFDGVGGCVGVPTYSGHKRTGFKRSEVLAGAFTAKQFTDPVGLGTQPVVSTQGANTFRNLGYQSVNANLSKGFSLPIPGVSEAAKFFLRAEAVNLFNRTNWQGIHNDPADANFGTVTNANQKRFLQLGGRFEF